MENSNAVTKEKKHSKNFLLAAVVLSLLVFLGLIRIFIIEIIISIVIAILVYPMFKYILKLVKGRRGSASLLSCVIIIISIFVPFVLISQILLDQSVEFYHIAGAQINELIKSGNGNIPDKLMNTYAGKWILEHKLTVNWQGLLEKVMGWLGTSGASLINKTSRFTFEAVFSLFIVMFSLFYFLRDGENLLLKIKNIIPLNEEYKERIIFRFYSMANATIKGILLIALLQSVLATLTLFIFGVKLWLLWGAIMLVFSVIPFVGTGVVLVPAGIFKILNGHTWEGTAIILISICFISIIDNVLRPRIVGKHAGMHDLMVFFSILGGVISFGPAGFIIGPLIAAIFLAVIEIYKLEFYQHDKRQEPVICTVNEQK